MDYAALPPEINSGRMYAGAGSVPMWLAAAAWDGLGAELTSAAAAYRSVVSGLTVEAWMGPASMSMRAAAIVFASWMSTTAEQVKQAARQARAAATAYEAAFAATVPPALIAENRALLASLVASNIFGQNTPAISATETQYGEMWAQDATTMYTYAGGSAAASRLTAFTDPPQTTDPSGVSAQEAAVSQASTSAAASPKALNQVLQTVPNVLQTLAGDAGNPTLSEIFNITASGTYVASGVLFILGPLFAGPVNAVLPATVLGTAAPALGAAGAAAGLLSDTTPVASSLGAAAGTSGSTGVLAGLGRALPVGGLSVPPAWASAAPVLASAARALPEAALAGLPEAAIDGIGPGAGAFLPGSLMAAAAGGGGAAGGGFAATRAGAASQRGATPPPDRGTPAQYGPPPALIPQVARAAAPHEGMHSQAMRTNPRASAGDGVVTENLREELNDLRKQISDLALERDVLMRSLALWARGTTE
ncbi:PPE family protein [Mycobacterium montefiorense]|uniref:PPE family protein n=2 Tax=Mycobacterium montefiorense TaxID=154654 RepID=UPI0021F2DE98|nr:PPE family protein [Mycobacterium montefiorense]MCV7428456.1 PPE family protein [Mycobacterium montefiorense]